MTSKRSLASRTPVLSAFVLCLAALTVLIAFAGPAQQGGTSQASAKPSAAPATEVDAPVRAVLPALHAVASSSRIVSRLQAKRHVAPVMAPDDSLSFLPVVTYDSGEVGASSIAVGDLNGDGKPDLVVANCGARDSACIGFNASTVGVLLGNGDGTFRPAVTYDSGGLTAVSVVIADVNGDGLPDLLVANRGYGGGLVAVLLGNGDGTFKPAVSYASGGQFSSSVAVADVNGDGKPDLVVANECADSNCDGSVGVLLGNGDGTFQTAVTYSSGGTDAFSVAVADVNGDSKPDILVATSTMVCIGGTCRPVSAVGVLLGKGDGTFGTASTFGAGGLFAGNQSIVIADVNGDGQPDIVVENTACCGSSSGAVGVLLGNGDGTFQTVVLYQSNGGGAGTYAVVADIDGDGKLDLVFTDQCASSNCNNGLVGVMLGNGDGTFQSAVTFSSGGTLTNAVAVADINGDGKPDLVVANQCADNGGSCPGGSVGVLLNNTTFSHSTTSTTLTSSPNPSTQRQPVTFTATVTSTGGTPPNGESVTFHNGVSVLGTASLSAGIASLITSSLPIGTFTITATYGGDANFAASTSPTLRQVVNAGIKSATSTTISSSLNPSIQGQPITFTATVTSSGGTPPNGETVTFYTGINVLGTAPMTGGIASLTTSSVGSGIHTISAAYLGDASFAGSTSPGLEQAVDTKSQSSTTTALTSSLNPSVYGQKVTWTATVTTTGSTTPTGNVTFSWGSDSIGTAKLNSSGVATLSKSNLNAGAYPLFAVYLGDTNNGPSASPILNQVITQAASTATITSSLNPSIQGESVTFTATITSPTTTPTGPVTFTAGKTTLGTVELSHGKATLTTTTLAVGSTKVTVTYPWNSNIAASSASVTQVVQQ